MVVHSYYPVGETRVEREAGALSGQGILVDVICLRHADEESVSCLNGVEVHRLPLKRHRGSGLLFQLLEYAVFFVLSFVCLTRLYLEKRYDVVQVHNLPDFLVFVALIPQLMGAKIILDLHDLMPEFYAERFHRPMSSWLVRLICWEERLSCRFADQVITVTELWRQSLIERGQPADKVTVVMNLADDSLFFPRATSPRPQNGHFRLIYHGTLGRIQGTDLVLQAVHKIRHAAPDITLTLHGWGAARPSLQELCAQLALQDCVQFTNSHLATSDLPGFLSNADLAIVPYRNDVFSGGILPTKLMEYAALGIPAVAARTPAISMYFDDTTVQFFTPGDVDELAGCILMLYRDREKLAELARNITRFCDRHSWTRVRAEYATLVEQMGAGQTPNQLRMRGVRVHANTSRKPN